ncbi:predicted protein [Histoplasma capsulatum G186AR]|uniref:Uncharacterized protein n=1 Tax=Ajellomyces capsulatus (strain G186AR / H82 / ATCC MYA-2454 / RMSCC 2432) TaxID=447093 RepID=C0NQ01_AJECG|nr:uncharacterized protein HCBG_05231 [Histoplasma capsulatum G186AR]EEH07011.1 predicted protein [Histoplasma capsulatum G186AR]
MTKKSTILSLHRGVVDQQSSNDSGAKSVKMGHQGISRSSRQDQKQTESKQINRDKGSLNSTRVVMPVKTQENGICPGFNTFAGLVWPAQQQQHPGGLCGSSSKTDAGQLAASTAPCMISHQVCPVAEGGIGTTGCRLLRSFAAAAQAAVPVQDDGRHRLWSSHSN